MSTTSTDGRRRHDIRRMHPTTRHSWGVIGLLLLALVFYLWTAGTSSPFVFARADQPNWLDTYNLLTSALLHGHLSLPLPVPQGLLALRDPYNPTLNLGYQSGYHDLILYHDRFYSAWGPSPSLMFMIVRVTGYRLPTSLAVAIYCFVGLAFAVALLHLLARRFLPGMPDWGLTVATAGLALTNVAPFILRRPSVYEVAISGAYCFAMSGLYLIASAALAERLSLRRVVAGSLLLGLALLARPTMAIGLFVLLVVAWRLIRRGCPRGRVLLAGLLPFLACGLALAMYNALRFGSLGDFGTQFQLAGIEVLHHPTEELAYVVPGMFSYLFIPGQVSLQFPHFFLQTTEQLPFAVPSNYEGAGVANGIPELAGGLLPTMPITILLLGLPIIWVRHRREARPVLLLISAGVVLTLMVMFLLAYALWGTTQRYEMDYASLAVISAFLLWGLLLERSPPRSTRRRVTAAAGILLTTLGAAAGMAVSFTGYSGLLQANHPATFDDLEDATSPLVTLITEFVGSPLLVRVSGAGPLGAPPGSPYTQFDVTGSTAETGGLPVTLTVISPHAGSDAITAIASPGVVPIKGQVLKVRAQDGALSAVPVLGASVRIPVHLSAGLNRIEILSANASVTQLSQIVLSDLRVTR